MLLWRLGYLFGIVAVLVAICSAVAATEFTPAKYDEAITRLEAAGAGAPAGRLYHVALETDGQIQVFDVWESEQTFAAFGQHLMPILAGLGIDPGEPQISEIELLVTPT